MRQYLEIKARYCHALLFYRMGDFYELFFDDAIDASKILDIALTKRGKHDGEDIPMCGVPVHAAEQYLLKLIAAERIVAICEQLESPEEAKKRGYKAIVKRDVVRLVTPSTITEEALLEPTTSTYMMAIARSGNMCACAWADISTADFYVEECPEASLAALLARVDPKEILLADEEGAKNWFAALSAKHPQWLSPSAFHVKQAERAMLQQWNLATLDGLPEYSPLIKSAMGAVLHYIGITQLGAKAMLRIPLRARAMATLQMDAPTRRSLELTHTQYGEKKGSFLWAIDRTNTAAGARALLARVRSPSRDLKELTRWQEQTALFYGAAKMRNDLAQALGALPDLERVLTRISLGRCGPRDLLSVRQAISVNNDIIQLLSNNSSSLAQSQKHLLDSWVDALSGHATLLQLLQEALKPDAPMFARDGNFIAAGYRPDLDEYRSLRDESKRVMLGMEQELKIRTGIASLKIKHNNMLGYFIEITAIHESKVPNEFIRRQGLAGSLRYSTPELVDLARKIDEAGEKALQLELMLFDELCHNIRKHAVALMVTAKALAEIDVACGFAELAARNNYARPSFSTEGEYRVVAGRHPVVETMLEKQHQEFMANDCNLSQLHPMWLMTGPNMGGKSTFLRQNALIVLLAHMGSYVPAQSAIVPLVDQVFSRVGASDDLARGKSTFMVEMAETAAILHQATAESFVILDEIGRGTATFDGMAIASAVVRYLLTHTRAKALFATHYHELTSLASEFTTLLNYQVEAKEYKGNLIFMHKISPGTADRSYGIQVAALAGMPKEVVKNAKEILQDYEIVSKSAYNMHNLPLLSFNSATTPDEKSERDTLREALDSLDIDQMNPKQALDLLYKWKSGEGA